MSAAVEKLTAPVSVLSSAASFTFSKADRHPKVNAPLKGDWHVLVISHPFSRYIKVK
jgi:hypothetical protein